MQYTLRKYQEEAVEVGIDFFLEKKKNKKRSLMVLPTGCLSWDTIINENRCTLGRKKMISKMFLSYNGLHKHRNYNYDKSIPTFVRSYIKDTKTIQLNEINGITYSGIKPLLKLILENGIELKATRDHKIMTKNGWVEMQHLNESHLIMCDTLRPKKGTKKIKTFYDTFVCNLWYHPFSSRVRTKKEKRGYTDRIEIHRFVYEANINNLSFDEYKFILRKDEKRAKTLKYVDSKKFDIHHIDGNHYNNEVSNLIKLGKREHQQIHSVKNKYNFHQGQPIFSKVVSVEYYGEDHTYDISCIENHNFVANGIVVHNSGKSLVIANIAKELNDNVLILQPSKELLLQNYEKFISYDYEASIYSASVGQKEIGKVTFATIGSVYKKPELFKDIKYIILDEAHVCSQEKGSMHQKFFNSLNVNLLGLTATPIRTKSYNFPEPHSKINMLTRIRPKVFQDIIHVTQIQEMIEDEYWSQLLYIEKPFDRSKLKLNSTGANYTEQSVRRAMKSQNVIEQAIYYAHKLRESGRKKILIFAPSIYDSAYIANELGIEAVSSETNKQLRSEYIDRFKNGDLWGLANVNVLAIGFDEPKIDAIIDLTPTTSFARLYQRYGRGVRIHPEKEDCIVVDLVGNVNRFGKIENIKFEIIDGRWETTCKGVVISGVPME